MGGSTGQGRDRGAPEHPGEGPDQPPDQVLLLQDAGAVSRNYSRHLGSWRSKRSVIPPLLSLYVWHKPFSGLLQGGVTKAHSTAIKHHVFG